MITAALWIWWRSPRGVEGDKAIVSIANTGPVMPPEQVHRLFDPFQRLDRTRVDDHHGLGLSIVKIGPTGRAKDAAAGLHAAIAEAERVTDLDDVRDDRGLMDVVNPDEYVLGQVPAPIAAVTDNGPCFHGGIYADVLRG